MSFTSVSYVLLLPLVAIIYYCAPKKLQNYVLLLASISFYAFNLPKGVFFGKNIMPLALIIASALFTYFIGLKIEKSKKKSFVLLGVGISVLVLAVFKYSSFLIPVLFGPSSLIKLGFPLGISYYTFMAISYLIDVYRQDIKAEKNFVHLFVYMSFFGTIAAGPICRASAILPQLKTPHSFDSSKMANAMRLALIGFFKQIAVANILSLSINVVFNNAANYGSLVLILAVLLYSAQLYYEFSGYSDLALASGAVFGLELTQNFKTPYFATSFSGFWSRWHISLSTWLQDYVFMPLVWGRWTSRIPVIGKKVSKPPMISSVAIVFIVSGLWHGNTLPFAMWGALMAVYRVGEELLHKYYKKAQKKPSLALRSFKRVGVYLLWSFGLIFFKYGNIENGTARIFEMIKGIFVNQNSSSVFAQISGIVQEGFYPKPVMVYLYVAFMVFVLALAAFMDWYQFARLKDKHISVALTKLSPVLRWLVYYGFIGVILLAFIMQSGGYGGIISTAYANF